MARRNADWNEDKLSRWIKEGRGQGEGRDYKPWITVTDMTGVGNRYRKQVVEEIKRVLEGLGKR